MRQGADDDQQSHTEKRFEGDNIWLEVKQKGN
jgi:hypothetical protein